LIDAAGAVAGVEMQEDLCIAVGVKRALELLPQLFEIVDLSVVGEGEVTVGHRLVAGWREVENGQAGMPQVHTGGSPDLLMVWTPVSQAPGHSLDDRGLGWITDDADDAAHF